MTVIPVCPLCHATSDHRQFSQRGYQVFHCSRCDLFFIHPYPSAAAEIHKRVMEDDREEMEVQRPLKQYIDEVYYYDKFFPMIEQESQSAKSLLDVGCGCGNLLERFAARPGLYRVGIELNRSRAQMAREKAGCEIHNVPIEEFNSNCKFDVIILMNVLSHVQSFDSLFLSLKSLLSENGKVILKVGENAENIRKTAVFDWEIPEHLHFLGLKTIGFICEKYRFQVLKHERWPLSRDLFSECYFRMPGRSGMRNLAKSLFVKLPPMLAGIRKCYEIVHGQSAQSSFIVLECC